MHRMVLDLLDLVRLDAGTFELQLAPVDLPALLNNIVEKFSPQAHAAGVSINVESTAVPAIMGDGDRLAQVFSNLLDNSLKHTPAGGIVTLRTGCPAPRFRWKWRIPVRAFQPKPCRTYLSASTRLILPGQAVKTRNRLGAGDRQGNCGGAQW